MSALSQNAVRSFSRCPLRIEEYDFVLLIAEKLGVSQPTVSEHLKILSQAGLLTAKRVKQWTFYKRDEARIAKLKVAMLAKI